MKADQETISRAINLARLTMAKNGYKGTAVIAETEYAPEKYTVGFFFSENEPVGFKGTHPSGERYEVLATTSL